jgi:hypothetical protein
MVYHWSLLEGEAVVEPFVAGWSSLLSRHHLLVPVPLTDSAVFSLLLNHFFPFYLYNAIKKVILHTKCLILKHQITYFTVLLCTYSSPVLSSKV